MRLDLDPADVAALLDLYLEPEMAAQHDFNQFEVYVIGRAADALRKRGPSGAPALVDAPPPPPPLRSFSAECWVEDLDELDDGLDERIPYWPVPTSADLGSVHA